MMILPPLLFAGLAALFLVGLLRDDPNVLPSTFVGQPAPPLVAAPIGNLPSFDRAVLEAPGLKIVNFWASWCAPCRAEHPNLIALSAELPIYGVNQDKTPGDALGFLQDLGNPFTANIFDATKRQSINWGVYGLPESFLIDGKGTILLRIVGPLTKRVIQNTLRPAIAVATQ
jgi:cytochrome c biogenesis protein CcmG/thiol:disulfide interchange protein DsbE